LIVFFSTWMVSVVVMPVLLSTLVGVPWVPQGVLPSIGCTNAQVLPFQRYSLRSVVRYVCCPVTGLVMFASAVVRDHIGARHAPPS
jgi:hypothetical protein